MVGAGVGLRTTRFHHRSFVQIRGRAVRLPAGSAARELIGRHDEMDRLAHVQVQALMAQIARSARCNRGHSVDERTARWLLMSHDRVGSDRFDLTQEFLGQMLGVARPRVSIAAATRQRVVQLTGRTVVSAQA